MEPFDKAWHTAADTLKNDYRTSEQQWTGQSSEPIAGVQGKGTATDPYDAGNRPEQPGAPQTQENTALVPEALSSITSTDRSLNLNSSNTSKVASGPAAMQPELNPIGETAEKYGSQPHRAPEQRDVRSTGGVGDKTSAQTSASHPTHLRHTGRLGDAMPAQTSALGADTPSTGLRDTSSGQKSALDRGTEPSGLEQTTPAQKSPLKSSLEKDARTTGLGQLASSHEPSREKDTQTSPLEAPRISTSTGAHGTQTQIPDRTSRSIGTGAIHPSSGVASSTGSEARHPSTNLGESTQKSVSEQRTPSTTDGHGSSEKETKTYNSGQKSAGGASEPAGFTPKTDHVSKEALRGPSVSEPREHWKKDEQIAKAEDNANVAGGQPEGGAKHESGSEKKKDHSSRSSRTMAQIKEKVEKVIHPHKA